MLGLRQGASQTRERKTKPPLATACMKLWCVWALNYGWSELQLTTSNDQASKGLNELFTILDRSSMHENFVQGGIYRLILTVG